jgi:hypothetical protein
MILEAFISINSFKAAVWDATTESGRFAWVYDPEGNKVELWEPK